MTPPPDGNEQTRRFAEALYRDPVKTLGGFTLPAVNPVGHPHYVGTLYLPGCGVFEAFAAEPPSEAALAAACKQLAEEGDGPRLFRDMRLLPVQPRPRWSAFDASLGG